MASVVVVAQGFHGREFYLAILVKFRGILSVVIFVPFQPADMKCANATSVEL